MLFEVSSRLLYDHNRVRIGRAGAVRDVTELRLKVEELRENIAEVLHTYSSALMHIRTSLSVILPSLNPNPFGKGELPSAEQISKTLSDPAKKLANSIRLLVNIGDSQERSSVLPQTNWLLLTKQGETLRDFQSTVPYKEAHLSTVRHATLGVVNSLEQLQRGKLPRERLREVRNDAREVVLDAFKSVIYEVLKAPRYTGRELKELLESFRNILGDKESGGNDYNYFKTAQLLNETWNRVSKLQADLPANSDAGLAASLLGELGMKALRTMSEKTALAYVGFAGECRDQKTIFALGLEALRIKRFRIASGALNKLESLAMSRKLTPNNSTSSLLGLLAHFIDYGTATRERAEEFLLKRKASFSPSFETCLNAAIYHHYYDSNYDTVDSLAKMLPIASNEISQPAIC